MLPKSFPPYPDRSDIDIYASLAPAREVGGDFYDFLIRDEKLFFCIGDVSGKGIPAALVMAVTRTLFRNVTSHESMPQAILTIMNDALADNNESNMFVTMFVGVLDLKTGKLLYSNAGHDAPLLVAKATESLPCDANLPIGIMEHWQYTLQEAVVAPKTTIFLYTDGLTEAENASHEQFGMEHILQVTTLDRQARPLIVNMTDAVHDFVAEAEQSDDLTLMAIHYDKELPGVTLQRSITLSNDVNEVPLMTDFITDIAESLQMTPSDTMQVNLAVEEAVVNVMNYAYPEGTKGDVNIAATADGQQLTLTITDSGTPFDPTARSEVDITQPLDERPIGGLGIHLVRNIMDAVSYQRVGDTNQLTITKRYNQL
jgi:sigma-B regulation protein RsbU (phosphoserine phosphatase)